MSDSGALTTAMGKASVKSTKSAAKPSEPDMIVSVAGSSTATAAVGFKNS